MSQILHTVREIREIVQNYHYFKKSFIQKEGGEGEGVYYEESQGGHKPMY